MVRATFSRLDKLDKPRLEFELRSASCRPPQRLQRHTPHSNWSDDTEHASGRVGGSAVPSFDESVAKVARIPSPGIGSNGAPSLLGRLSPNLFSRSVDRRTLFPDPSIQT